jgi:hypothetical protein
LSKGPNSPTKGEEISDVPHGQSSTIKSGSLETFFPTASEEFSATESSHDLHEHLDPLQSRLPICRQILFDAGLEPYCEKYAT